MIIIDKLKVTYPDGTVALHDVSLKINKGELVLVLGRSGSGKSTLGKVLSGVIPHIEKAHVEGFINVAGLDPTRTDITSLSRTVTYLAQSPHEQVIFTYVRDELELVLYSRYGEKLEDYITKVVKSFGIEHLLDRRTSELSGGELQKVLIASIVLAGSEIIIFDEPLAHLDPESCRDFLKIVKELKQHDKTIILIEHRFSELIDLFRENVVDKVILLDNGKVVDVFPGENVLNKISILAQHGIRLPCNLAIATKFNIEVKSVDDDEILRLILEKDGTSIICKHEDSINGKTILEIRNLYAAYKRSGLRGEYCWVLKDINLTVTEGQIVCVMGPNGSGKSTLLLAILRKVPYLRGTILIEGAKRRNLRGYVMYIPQNPDLVLMYETVEKELLARARLSSRSRQEAYQKIKKIADMLGLSGVLSKNPQALSRGQRFRVAIAAALVAEPKLLLLDEPTVGQDEENVHALGSILRSYVNDSGAGAIVITHDVNFSIEYSDKIILLKDGKIIAQGTFCEVFSREEVIKKCRILLNKYTRILVEKCVKPSAVLHRSLLESAALAC